MYICIYIYIYRERDNIQYTYTYRPGLGDAPPQVAGQGRPALQPPPGFLERGQRGRRTHARRTRGRRAAAREFAQQGG